MAEVNLILGYCLNCDLITSYDIIRHGKVNNCSGWVYSSWCQEFPSNKIYHILQHYLPGEYRQLHTVTYSDGFAIASHLCICCCYQHEADFKNFLKLGSQDHIFLHVQEFF